MTRPRAADDFPAIRARLEEMRRERAGVPADVETRQTDAPAVGSRLSLANRVVFPPAIIRRRRANNSSESSRTSLSSTR